MKTVNRLFGILLGATALFLSCTKQENPVRQEGNTFEMTIVAGSDQTRTVLGSDGTVNWSASGEQLAVMEAAVSGTKTTTAKVASSDGVTTDGGATMTFGVSMTSKTADSFDYYALYPNSAYVDTPSDFTKVKVKLASTQAPTESSFGPSADVLVAKPVTGLTSQPKELNLQFARVIAVGKMTIKNLNTTENVKKVTFTAAGKAVTGRSYIDFTTADGVEYGYSGQGVDNVILDYSDKTIAANGMTAYFTCWPFELAAGETFSVVVETENYTFTKDITLAEDKSLAFNVGRASAFNVNFDGIEGVAKAPVTQLVPDGAYVVAYDKNMMTVGTSSNKYRDVATLPTANEDGSYSVDATAAWNFVYDSTTDTYKISSASDNTLYLQGSSTGSDFKLVAETDATSFSITKKDDGTFKIGITSGSNTRYIGYNTQSPRFAMYAGSTQQPVDLNLYPAKVVILPKIDVQETLEVPSAETTSSFPVTLTNVETADVAVYKDAACTTEETEWITANLSTDQTAIEYLVYENTTSEARTAYIKIYALGPDANEASAIITVTQAKAVALTAYPYSESFAESQGEFTIDNVTMPSPLTYVWKYTTYNGDSYMKASAYVSGANYATESWLISPVIDMSSAVNPVLSFMTVARYGSNENLTLWAREKGGDWAQLSFSNYGTGNDWNFVSNTVDLSAYAGKTLQFAYKYVSTGSGASTWEIKNVEVKEQGAAATLSSIAWTGYTTTYTVGDVFKADGTVTATYSDGSTKDVTSEASFSTPDMSTAGAKTVTITYDGETTTGEITVKAAGAATDVTETFDFESESTGNTFWIFTNMTSNQTGTLTAHGGTYYGTTGGNATASITTKAVIKSPKSITFYVSRQSTNTKSSSWKLQVSSDNSTWTDVKTQSATSMDKGSWVEVTQDLSSYSNVYVRVYYTGSTAVRNIDDLSLTYSN